MLFQENIHNGLQEKMSDKNETLGKMRLYLDNKVVDEKPFRTQAGHYSLSGEGLCVGRDSGDPVSKQYKAKFDFTGGKIAKAVVVVEMFIYNRFGAEPGVTPPVVVYTFTVVPALLQQSGKLPTPVGDESKF